MIYAYKIQDESECWLDACCGLLVRFGPPQHITDNLRPMKDGCPTFLSFGPGELLGCQLLVAHIKKVRWC